MPWCVDTSQFIVDKSLIFTKLIACGDVVKKPKLDQHRGRCGSGFDCIDCSTTFNTPADYKGHTQCISEAEKYQKSLYKGPKTVRCDVYITTQFQKYNIHLCSFNELSILALHQGTIILPPRTVVCPQGNLAEVMAVEDEEEVAGAGLDRWLLGLTTLP